MGMNTFRSHIGLWSLILFSPIILWILHDSMLCSFAPAYGIHGGDAPGCGLGWGIFGIISGYGITIALAVGVAFIGGLGLWLFKASPETRQKVVVVIMWIPLAGVLMPDFMIVSVPFVRIAYEIEQARICSTSKPIITALSSNTNGMTIGFSEMPSRVIAKVYNSTGALVVTDAFGQQEKGNLSISPPDGKIFEPGSYQIVAAYGDSECAIAEISLSIVGFDIGGYWGNAAATGPSKIIFEEDGLYEELPRGTSEYLLGTWKTFTADDAPSGFNFVPEKGSIYLMLAMRDGRTRYYKIAVGAETLAMADVSGKSLISFIRLH